MGRRITTMTSGQKHLPVAPSLFKFARHGRNGAWLSQLLPHTAKIIDDLCLIKSMQTEAINHDPAITFVQTGSQLAGRPSMGSWIAYGLGSMNDDLPAFVVLLSRGDTDQPSAALVQDLKQRGLLDDTLIIWGGEFGRTMYSQGQLTATNYCRDHHPRCFTIWQAGGGVQPSRIHGETDDFSYNSEVILITGSKDKAIRSCSGGAATNHAAFKELRSLPGRTDTSIYVQTMRSKECLLPACSFKGIDTASVDIR
jgi:hypothetical protein